MRWRFLILKKLICWSIFTIILVALLKYFQYNIVTQTWLLATCHVGSCSFSSIYKINNWYTLTNSHTYLHDSYLTRHSWIMTQDAINENKVSQIHTSLFCWYTLQTQPSLQDLDEIFHNISCHSHLRMGSNMVKCCGLWEHAYSYVIIIVFQLRARAYVFNQRYSPKVLGSTWLKS